MGRRLRPGVCPGDGGQPAGVLPSPSEMALRAAATVLVVGEVGSVVPSYAAGTEFVSQPNSVMEPTRDRGRKW